MEPPALPGSRTPEPPPNPELMRSLGRLVRGLSALFWGLPAALVVCFHTAKTDGFRSFGVLPPVVCTGLIVFGLLQMGGFQRQERVWRNALDAATLLSFVNLGLSPFLFFSNRVPNNPFFLAMVMAMAVCGLLFLAALNLVLRRLGAMLPDEGLRLETRQFTGLNMSLLVVTLAFVGIYFLLGRLRELPPTLHILLTVFERGGLWVFILLVLLPLAMTMALLWKTKEVILENVFGPRP